MLFEGVSRPHISGQLFILGLLLIFGLDTGWTSTQPYSTNGVSYYFDLFETSSLPEVEAFHNYH